MSGIAGGSELLAGIPMQQPAEDPAEWAAGIRRVLRDPSALRLVFQPIVDLQIGQVVGYEALARFAGPPVAGPDCWFDRAQAIGLGADLEAVVLRRALAAAADLPSNCFLAVNVNPDSLDTDPVTAALAEPPSLAGIVIEITEQQSVEPAWLRRQVDRLRARGALVALDDAGAGYSGLQQMAAVRPDLIKLDRSLVDAVDRDPVKMALSELLGRFAGRLDAWILAEGVERIEELDAFQDLGFPLAQGYLLGRPAPTFTSLPAALGERLRERRRQQDLTTIASLVEAVPAVPDGPHPVSASLGAACVGVAVDARGRPTRLLIADEPGGHRQRPVSCQVLADSAVDDTILACLSRPATQRFDPVVCTHPDGRYAGIVRLERLIFRLATTQRTTVREESP